ncbi:DUF4184 family protein [Glutamicibacter sp. MCAF14]|uniref:DUF4184 family protein n=1 Tax=Glutamicibacter sp. MCAF14 TaxID=3233043 RepID=UPI003F8EC382
MPFTLSHPAAVLPFLRRPFIPAALVAGAMAPDLPYFLRVPVTAESWYGAFVNATYSHSAEGLVLVGLPSAALLLGVFHLVRAPLAELLPFTVDSLNRGLPRPASGVVTAGWTVISILIGLVSHLLWDSLTQVGSWLVSWDGVIGEQQLAGISLDRLLQHASTVIGLACIAGWGIRRFKTGAWVAQRRAPSSGRRLRGSIVLVLAVAASAGFSLVSLFQAVQFDAGMGLEHVASLLVKNAGMGTAICVLLYSLFWHVVRRASTRKSAAS